MNHLLYSFESYIRPLEIPLRVSFGIIGIVLLLFGLKLYKLLVAVVGALVFGTLSAMIVTAISKADATSSALLGFLVGAPIGYFLAWPLLLFWVFLIFGGVGMALSTWFSGDAGVGMFGGFVAGVIGAALVGRYIAFVLAVKGAAFAIVGIFGFAFTRWSILVWITFIVLAVLGYICQLRIAKSTRANAPEPEVDA